MVFLARFPVVQVVKRISNDDFSKEKKGTKTEKSTATSAVKEEVEKTERRSYLHESGKLNVVVIDEYRRRAKNLLYHRTVFNTI